MLSSDDGNDNDCWREQDDEDDLGRRTKLLREKEVKDERDEGGDAVKP